MNRSHLAMLVLSATSSIVLFQACGESNDGKVCVPGQSVACVGPAGCAGAQACRSDGRGYEACQCGLPFDAAIPPDTGIDDATADVVDSAVLDAPDDVPAIPDAGSTPWGDTIGKSIVGIVVDSKQNVIISGNLVADRRFFLAKYDSSGTLKWQKTGTSGQDIWHGGWAVAVDPTDDSVYAVSYTGESMDVGGGTLSPGGYIVKWDASGTFKWQRGGYSSVAWWCAGMKSNGDLVVGGDLTGSVDFGGGTITSNSNDAVLLEISSSNGYVRQKQFGPSSYSSQLIRTCAVDSSDNVLVGAWFDNVIDLGGGNINGPGSGARNLAVGKLDSTFGYKYQLDLKANGTNSYLEGLTSDKSGNVYVSGSFDTSIDLGGGTMNAASGTAFLGKLNSSLGHVYSKQFKSLSLAPGLNIAPDPYGRIAFAGGYVGSPNLGCGALPSSSDVSAFLALFDSSGKCVSNYTTNGTSNCSFNTVAYLSHPDFAVTGGLDGPCTFPSGTLSGGPGLIVRLKP